MKIKIPSAMMRVVGRFGDWANVPIWIKGRLELRRLDLFVVAFFFVCVAWYWTTGGWQGAAYGGAMYIAMTAFALWFF